MFELSLPSGRSIAIAPPKFIDRMEAVKQFRSQRDAGYILEELMAARALATVDGIPVAPEWEADVIMRFADWNTVDVSYYIEFFMTAFFPDDKLKEAAQEDAKKYMRGEQPAPKKSTHNSKSQTT